VQQLDAQAALRECQRTGAAGDASADDRNVDRTVRAAYGERLGGLLEPEGRLRDEASHAPAILG
jgi:hypothetical protein